MVFLKLCCSPLVLKAAKVKSYGMVVFSNFAISWETGRQNLSLNPGISGLKSSGNVPK